MKFANKRTKTLLVLSALALMPLACLAAPSGTSAGQPLIDKEFETALRKFICRRFFNRIDASPEQQDKLNKIIEETQEETRPQREEMRQGLLSLSALMADEKSSDDEIKAKVEELRELRQKLQDKRVTAMLAARKVLTAEQRQQIHEKIQELIGAGLKSRKIGFLMKGPAARILDI